MGIPFIFDLEQSSGEERAQIKTVAVFEADLPFLFILFFLLSLCLVSFYFLVREDQSISNRYKKNSFEFVSFAMLWIFLIGSTYFIFSSLNQTYTWNWEGIWSRRWQEQLVAAAIGLEAPTPAFRPRGWHLARPLFCAQARQQWIAATGGQRGASTATPYSDARLFAWKAPWH